MLVYRQMNMAKKATMRIISRIWIKGEETILMTKWRKSEKKLGSQR